MAFEISDDMLLSCVAAAWVTTAALVKMPVPQPAPSRGIEPMSPGDLALGFDFGTSGARCALIDAEGNLVCSPPPYPWGKRERRQTAADWMDALNALLESVPATERRRVSRIAVSGTSSSVIIFDEATGKPSERGVRMYDFNVMKQAVGESGETAMELIRAVAPDAHTVRSPTSALAKVVAWHCESPLLPTERIAHQADFIAAALTGGPIVSDWHNSLKLGYDVAALEFPAWMKDGELGDILAGKLPPVVMPGGKMGTLCPELAERLDMSADCVVLGGTTDSIAAFIASGAADIVSHGSPRAPSHRRLAASLTAASPQS